VIGWVLQESWPYTKIVLSFNFIELYLVFGKKFGKYGARPVVKLNFSEFVLMAPESTDAFPGPT